MPPSLSPSLCPPDPPCAGSEVATAAEQAARPVAAKKRKTGGAAAAAAPAVAAVTEAPLAALEGHSQCVAAVAWAAEGAVVSGAWDHSVRRFDVPSGINTDSYNGSKVVLALAVAPDTGGRLVALGGSDAAVRLWDVRVAGAAQDLGVSGFGGHGGWVSALAWRPECGHHFASASYDGAVKLWDVRAGVPLATLREHADKALALAWWDAQRLASGGADCQLRVYATGDETVVEA